MSTSPRVLRLIDRRQCSHSRGTAVLAIQQTRYTHSKRHSSYFPASSGPAPSTTSSGDASEAEFASPGKKETVSASISAPLSILPLSSIIRSYLITTISSSPFLLRPTLAMMGFLTRSEWAVCNPDVNPVLRFILKKTLYAQFCAGETPAEVKESVVQLKNLGYAGAILGYGREVVMDEAEAGALGNEAKEIGGESKEKETECIEAWRKGTLATVQLAEEGDFVALKFTGAGSQALRLLAHQSSPSPRLEEAIVQICELSKETGVRLLFDAEQAVVQDGIDKWALDFMSRYNKGKGGHREALVYGTYQAYRKSTPTTLARHLETAKNEGFTLGVKLVRGAYLGSDPATLFWRTKEETDRTYDGIAESLMKRRYNDVLKHPTIELKKEFAEVDLVLASHNRATVEKAKLIRNNQCEIGENKINLVFGQLQGMADEISCELVQLGHGLAQTKRPKGIDVPKAYKYLVWGTVGECTKYLLRRAQENRDAVSRTRDGRKAMGQELGRRMTSVLNSR